MASVAEADAAADKRDENERVSAMETMISFERCH